VPVTPTTSFAFFLSLSLSLLLTHTHTHTHTHTLSHALTCFYSVSISLSLSLSLSHSLTTIYPPLSSYLSLTCASPSCWFFLSPRFNTYTSRRVSPLTSKPRLWGEKKPCSYPFPRALILDLIRKAKLSTSPW
jgi:hypothetical protein